MESSKGRRLLVVLAAAAVVFAAGLLLSLAARPAQAVSPAAPNATYICTPVGVGVFNTRVHVRCSVATPEGISYFAYCATPDSATASRFLSAFTTAKVTGKNLLILYTLADTSGTACGCGAADCRAIWGAEVQQ